MRRLCVLLLPSLALAPLAPARGDDRARGGQGQRPDHHALRVPVAPDRGGAGGARRPGGRRGVPAPEQRQDPAGRDRRDPDPAEGGGRRHPRALGLDRRGDRGHQEGEQDRLGRADAGGTRARRADARRAAGEHRARGAAADRDAARRPAQDRGERGGRAGRVREGQGQRVHQAGHGHAAGDPDPRGQGRYRPRARARRSGPGRRGLRGAGADLFHGTLARQRRRPGTARAG